MKQLLASILAVLFPFLVFAQPPGVAQATNQFGFKLYKSQAKTEGNLFFSPLSLESALAMAAAGAREKTLEQMFATLQLSQNDHARFKELLSQLKGNQEFQLLVANRLWGQSGTPYHPEFLKVLLENYGADLSPLDFKHQPEPARDMINKWVAQQTQDKIKELLKPGSITPATDLVLTNAVYFKGTWAHEFDKEQTKDGLFQLSPSKTRSVPFMTRKANYRYLENAKLQYLQMPYKGHDLVMDILLPNPNLPLTKLEQELNAKTFTTLAEAATFTDVVVSFPKFKAESEFSLAPTLSSLGMPLAFDAKKANFSGMRKLNPGENLFLSAVIHKAFVDVNESGTEAAAATAALAIGGFAAPAPPKIFKANRPFLFFIRHVNSGTILFMGRLSHP